MGSLKLKRVTTRLIIRPLTVSDYQSWVDAQNSQLKQKNIWDRKPKPKAERNLKYFKRLISTQIKRRKQDVFYDFAAFRKSDGKLVGNFSIMEVVRGISQTSYLGYGLFNNYWGMGYAKEAVKAVLDIGFKNLKLHRIEAGIEPQNKRSIALARSLKMRLEGRKKRNLFLRGKWVDLLMYTLTCEELGINFRGPRPRYKPRV